MMHAPSEAVGGLADLPPVEVFDYYDGPRFFSVRDAVQQIFLVYWIDETEEGPSWLFLRISGPRYAAMKRGDISVADALSNPEEGVAYVVTGRDEKRIPATSIEKDWLPEPDYRLARHASTLPVRDIVAVDLSKLVHRQVLDLAFSKASNAYEIGARKLGRLMDALQSTVDALSCGRDHVARRVPDEIKVRSELMFTSVFESSFGVRLQTKGTDLFNCDATAEALQELARLLNAVRTPDTLASELHACNLLARSRFKHLLGVLVEAEVSLASDWGNPDGRTLQAQASFDDISNSLNRLRGVEESASRTILIDGRLVGVDIVSNFFAFVDLEGTVLKGELAMSLADEQFEVPSHGTAMIQESCEVDLLTDRERWKYLLLGISVRRSTDL